MQMFRHAVISSIFCTCFCGSSYSFDSIRHPFKYHGANATYALYDRKKKYNRCTLFFKKRFLIKEAAAHVFHLRHIACKFFAPVSISILAPYDRAGNNTIYYAWQNFNGCDRRFWKITGQTTYHYTNNSRIKCIISQLRKSAVQLSYFKLAFYSS